MIRLLALAIGLMCSSALCSQQILIDGTFEDWNIHPTSYVDTNNDGVSNDIDFDSLWVANDEDYIFLRLQVGKEINLQQDNKITLYIDIDQNPATGRNIRGIGADLTYEFGDRDGSLDDDGFNLYIDHEDIGLTNLPTVTSDQFEIVIKRKTEWYDMLNAVNIVIEDKRTGGDLLPNSGSVSYTFNNQITNNYPTYSIDKQENTDIRILSYNVENDGLFEQGTAEPLRRIITAVNPDIIAFQEIYDNYTAEVSAKVSDIFPNQEWFTKRINPDLFLVSKYPILKTSTIGGNGAHKVLIDDREVVIINCHLRCCDLDAERQVEVDRIIEFIRDSKEGETSFDIAENTPIIVLGDMNFVGDKRQVQTIQDGDISNENMYGEDHLPDWDNSSFEDVKSYATGLPIAASWYSYTSSFSPGRLDYVFYTGSVLKLTNAYSMFTPAMSAANLQAYNLQQNDAINAADHLALVTDFSFDLSSPTNDTDISITELSLYPNPAHSNLSIDFVPEDPNEEYQMRIFSVNGKYIRNVAFHQTQNFSKTIDISNMRAGSYYLEIKSQTGRKIKHFAVVK